MTLHPNGLFLRREALGYGYRDEDLAAARRSGRLHRVRHGAYVPLATWDRADSIDRFRLKGQAVSLTHEGRVALSHTSGAAEHGLRLWDVSTDHVHLVRLDGATGRRQRDVIYHEDSWAAADIHAKDELLLMSPEQCALGTAALATVESGLGTLDSYLDLDLGSESSLWAEYRRRAYWPHHAKLQITLRLMRPGAQSIAESRARFLFWSQHLPEPVLQYAVHDAWGQLVGITDFAWPEHRLLGEFDGMVKYGRLVKPGQSAHDVVVSEKRREDRLREVTGWGMIRLTWADLHSPEITAERVRRMMRRRWTA